MSEIPFSRSSDLLSIETVCSGTYIVDKEPSDLFIEKGNFITAQDFAQAGMDAGKSSNYGQGVMRDIALQMVGIEAENRWLVNGVSGNWIVKGTPEYDLYYRIFYMMNNPDEIKTGSRNRLLLGAELVHDVWRAGEGIFPPEDLPRLGKVGHRVVSMLFNEEIQARAEIVQEQSASLSEIDLRDSSLFLV